MSRARPITINGETHWFDTDRNHRKATDKQLELLATVEQVEDFEDLLESNITQGEVIRRLRVALGSPEVIPHWVLEKRQKWRKERAEQPNCRICGKIGDSTKHHFINKWILKELDNYAGKWSNRRENCIPLCIDCHRDLHYRNNGPVSIAEFLTDKEKRYADRALSQLAEERPKLLILIAKGDDSVYEARLIKDWLEGKFEVRPAEASRPLTQVA
jgi:hypothetical protein